MGVEPKKRVKIPKSSNLIRFSINYKPSILGGLNPPIFGSTPIIGKYTSPMDPSWVLWFTSWKQTELTLRAEGRFAITHERFEGPLVV